MPKRYKVRRHRQTNPSIPEPFSQSDAAPNRQPKGRVVLFVAQQLSPWTDTRGYNTKRKKKNRETHLIPSDFLFVSLNVPSEGLSGRWPS